jgi:hypothetical protein
MLFDTALTSSMFKTDDFILSFIICFFHNMIRIVKYKRKKDELNMCDFFFFFFLQLCLIVNIEHIIR